MAQFGARIARAVPAGGIRIRREHGATLDNEHIRIDLAVQASGIGEIGRLDRLFRKWSATEGMKALA